MLRWMWIVLVLAAGLSVPGGAYAASRVALVIGNAAYQNDKVLPNPANDAREVARVLRSLGFEVRQGSDLPLAAMQRQILEFGRAAAGADIALVYYAGHGIEVGGRNYLLPVDARLQDELALRVETVDVEMVLESVAQARTRILLFDACRNNPLANRMRTSGTGRSVGRGLARVEAVNNTLIAFATAPGTVAEDGSGSNSPFAAALVQHLPTPGLEIQQMLKRVRKSVNSATAGRQTPWDSSQLFEDVFLSPQKETAAPPALPTPPAKVQPLAMAKPATALGGTLKDQLSQRPPDAAVSTEASAVDLMTFRSYAGVDRTMSALEMGGYRPKRDSKHRQALKGLPAQNLDTVLVDNYRHLGQTGRLTLGFFNDQLFEVEFLPIDAEAYFAAFQLNYPKLTKSRTGRSEWTSGQLRMASSLELALSDVGRALKTRAYVVWQDRRLVAARETAEARFEAERAK